MLRHSALATVLALAAACSDSTTTQPTSPGGGAILPSADQFAIVRGRIIVNYGEAQAARAGVSVLLLTSEGDTLRLIGPVAGYLVGSTGVELLVRGQLDGNGAMLVAAYTAVPADGEWCGDGFRIIVDDPAQCAALQARMQARAVRR